MRKFVSEVIYPEAVRCEENGKRISQEVVDKIWCVILSMQLFSLPYRVCSEMNIFAMRIGKGKHLKGRTLLGGVITPEEFDHFHEVSLVNLRAMEGAYVKLAAHYQQ